MKPGEANRQGLPRPWLPSHWEYAWSSSMSPRDRCRKVSQAELKRLHHRQGALRYLFWAVNSLHNFSSWTHSRRNSHYMLTAETKRASRFVAKDTDCNV